VEVFKEGVQCSAKDLENFGSGPAATFQRLSKECPAFAVEYAAVGLRHIRKHWGPVNRKQIGDAIQPEADAMLHGIQTFVDKSPDIRALG
jgi:hypothetical protein